MYRFSVTGPWSDVPTKVKWEHLLDWHGRIQTCIAYTYDGKHFIQYTYQPQC
jgi:hypothetical protein